jgi:hypothetical protein
MVPEIQYSGDVNIKQGWFLNGKKMDVILKIDQFYVFGPFCYNMNSVFCGLNIRL